MNHFSINGISTRERQRHTERVCMHVCRGCTRMHMHAYETDRENWAFETKCLTLI